MPLAYWPLMQIGEEMPLAFTAGLKGNYSITLNGLSSFAAGTRFWLRDNFLGTQEEVTDGFSYAFTVTANPASQGTARFVLATQPVTLTGIKAIKAMSVTAMPNPAHGALTVAIFGTHGENATLELVDVSGRVVLTKTVAGNLEAIRLNISSLTAGLYTLRVLADDSIHQENIIVE